jgi:hypothetical protein
MKTALFLWGTLLIAASCASHAQTAGQMEYERQQREYWRQQEQQRQEQQRLQQVMQENARRQQESGRFDAGPGAGALPGRQDGQPSAGGRAAYQRDADRVSAARALWQKQPPLAAQRNPLLGRWTRPASTRVNSSDPFASLQALARGGLCEALFGGGVFEFRQDKLVGMDARTPAQELDRVEYRGNEKHVVVLPKTTLKLMEFDVDGPNRISWTGQNCVLVRVAAR